ncbi:MAG: hypothetical protein OXD46_02945 [Chloroflexi bacterium]|nr:hypothetical protein [Chloroflexota bacterium]
MRTFVGSSGRSIGKAAIPGISIAVLVLLMTVLFTGVGSASFREVSSDISTYQLTLEDENEPPRNAFPAFALTTSLGINDAPHSYIETLKAPEDLRRLPDGWHLYRLALEAESLSPGGLGRYPISVSVDAGGSDASAGPAETGNYRQTVTISASDSPIAEGENVSFVLTRQGETTSELAVSVSVTEDGAMISGTPPTSVMIPVGQASGTLTVATENDNTAEDDSVITVTLIGRTFTDADHPIPVSPSANVSVRDDDPVVSFTAQDSITEGEPAVFTFRRVGGISYNLALNLDFFLEGQFLQDYEIGELWFEAGEAAAVLSIPTEDDDTPEQDGYIGVHLQPRYYTLDIPQPYYPEEPVYQEVVVRDNDRPAVTTTALTLMKRGITPLLLEAQGAQLHYVQPP